jgi:predicted dehydrogenase
MSLSSGKAPVRTVVIGCGRMARGHIRSMLAQQDTTQVVAVSEPSAGAYDALATQYQEAGLTPPPNEVNLDKLLVDYGSELDAAFIITPHAYHCAQTKACLEAGLDVLLEKPMVVNAQEAEELIETRDRTGKLLVVAFPGSLSPRIRTASAMLRRQELGEMLSIHGMTWEHWRTPNLGTWRQVPELAGGGFFFDTGAHMLNTVADLAGEEFTEVAAWFDNRNTAVEITGVAMAKLASGGLVTFHACGDAGGRARSDVRVCCTLGNLYTGIWGEKLAVQHWDSDEWHDVEVPPSMGVWQQFLAVRDGLLENPCPPEVGLRMARLWDAIRASAERNGQPVYVGSV